MSNEIKTQVVVLGGGPGGYSAAFRAADLGLDVTLIESRNTLGGVCLNVGCIPSKALLHVAKVIDDASEMASHGVTFGAPQIDLDKIRSWKESVIGQLTGGLDYCVKFHVSLSDLSKYAINNITAHIGVDPLVLDTKGDIIFNNRKEFSNVVKNATNKIYNARYNWETVCGTFRANGKEKYITVGNFFNNKDTKYQKLKKLANFQGTQKPLAYYYIDQVEVFTNSILEWFFAIDIVLFIACPLSCEQICIERNLNFLTEPSNVQQLLDHIVSSSSNRSRPINQCNQTVVLTIRQNGYLLKEVLIVFVSM